MSIDKDVTFGQATNEKWLAVDLDGTLAIYDGWKGEEHIGDIIEPVAEKIKERVAEGWNVAIFTARVSSILSNEVSHATSVIWKWIDDNDMSQYISGITAVKGKHFIEFWDDRAFAVEKNKGVFTEEWLRSKLEIERAEVKRLQGLLYAKNTQNATAIDKLQQYKDAQNTQQPNETACSLDVQIGGNHYSKMVIQPAEYCEYNNIPALESAVIKYVSRHQNKNGVQDLEKAKDLINMIIDMRYDNIGIANLEARLVKLRQSKTDGVKNV